MNVAINVYLIVDYLIHLKHVTQLLAIAHDIVISIYHDTIYHAADVALYVPYEAIGFQTLCYAHVLILENVTVDMVAKLCQCQLVMVAPVGILPVMSKSLVVAL